MVDRETSICISPAKARNFRTSCWWCGETVFFYRNKDNGGCALFDEIGYPWILHPCWEKNDDLSKYQKIKNFFKKEFSFNFEENIYFGNNYLIIHEIICAAFSDEINQNTLILLADDIFSKIFKNIFLKNIYDSFLSNKNFLSSKVFKGNDIFDFLVILKKFISKKLLSTQDRQKALNIFNRNEIFKDSRLIKFINGEINQEYYFDKVKEVDQIGKFGYFNFNIRNLNLDKQFIFLLGNSLNYNNLSLFLINEKIIINNSKHASLCNDIFGYIFFGKKSNLKLINLLIQDNIFEHIKKIIEDGVCSRGNVKINGLLTKNGLSILCDAILRIRSFEQELNEEELIYFRRMLNIQDFKNKSYMVSYLFGYLSFEKLSFFYDMMKSEPDSILY